MDTRIIAAFAIGASAIWLFVAPVFLFMRGAEEHMDASINQFGDPLHPFVPTQDDVFGKYASMIGVAVILGLLGITAGIVVLLMARKPKLQG